MRHFNKLETKRIPQLFLGLLLGMRRSAIGSIFSWSLVTIPEVFAKVNSAQFPSRVYMANTESREPRRC